MIDQFHKSHDAPVPDPTMHYSEQRCAHFCSECCIVAYETGALWALWDWCIGPVAWVMRGSNSNLILYLQSNFVSLESTPDQTSTLLHGKYTSCYHLSSQWMTLMKAPSSRKRGMFQLLACAKLCDSWVMYDVLNVKGKRAWMLCGMMAAPLIPTYSVCVVKKTNPPMPKKTMVINDVPREPSWVSGCHAIFIFIQKSYDTAWWFLVAWCQLIPSIIGNLHDTISRWVLSNRNVIAIRIWACHYQIMEGLSFPRTLFYSIVIMWYVCCMTRF